VTNTLPQTVFVVFVKITRHLLFGKWNKFRKFLPFTDKMLFHLLLYHLRYCQRIFNNSYPLTDYFGGHISAQWCKKVKNRYVARLDIVDDTDIHRTSITAHRRVMNWSQLFSAATTSTRLFVCVHHCADLCNIALVTFAMINYNHGLFSDYSRDGYSWPAVISECFPLIQLSM